VWRYAELRHALFDLTLHLSYVYAHFIAIDWTVRLEVEDHADSVTAQRLLIERAFNYVNRILLRFIPLICEIRIVPLPAIGSLA
jgi:hypothetical protein